MALEPGHIERLYRQSKKAFEARQYAEAEKGFRVLIREQGRWSDSALKDLVSLLLTTDRPREALQLIDANLHKRPDQYRSLLNLRGNAQSKLARLESLEPTLGARAGVKDALLALQAAWSVKPIPAPPPTATSCNSRRKAVAESDTPKSGPSADWSVRPQPRPTPAASTPEKPVRRTTARRKLPPGAWLVSKPEGLLKSRYRLSGGYSVGDYLHFEDRTRAVLFGPWQVKDIGGILYAVPAVEAKAVFEFPADVVDEANIQDIDGRDYLTQELTLSQAAFVDLSSHQDLADWVADQLSSVSQELLEGYRLAHPDWLAQIARQIEALDSPAKRLVHRRRWAMVEPILGQLAAQNEILERYLPTPDKLPAVAPPPAVADPIRVKPAVGRQATSEPGELHDSLDFVFQNLLPWCRYWVPDVSERSALELHLAMLACHWVVVPGACWARAYAGALSRAASLTTICAAPGWRSFEEAWKGGMQGAFERAQREKEQVCLVYLDELTGYGLELWGRPLLLLVQGHPVQSGSVSLGHWPENLRILASPGGPSLLRSRLPETFLHSVAVVEDQRDSEGALELEPPPACVRGLDWIGWARACQAPPWNGPLEAPADCQLFTRHELARLARAASLHGEPPQAARELARSLRLGRKESLLSCR